MKDPKKILIIDDEIDLIRLLSKRLTESGYSVEQALDGQEGLQKVKECNPDLILLDVMMPVINGATVCGILKFDKEYTDIPIIMLTAKGRDIDKEIGSRVKADAYVTKPFDSHELMEKIRELLK